MQSKQPQRQEHKTRPILVVGATGRHGGTGAFVARSLLEKQLPVRALVRGEDDRARTLRAAGAEVVVGDLHESSSLLPALAGVDTAFFTYPVGGGIVAAAANFAVAARAAGVTRVVTMSMGASRADSPSHLGRAHWVAEQVLEWSGLHCLHLRVAAFFYENLALLHRADIEGDGVIRNSYPGDVTMSWIAASDAGKLAVAALLKPARFGASTGVYPNGGHAYSFAQLTQLLGAHLGRALRHETISPDAWRRRLVALSAHEPRISDDMARHISVLGSFVRGPMRSDASFEALTGEAAQSLPDALAAGGLGLSRSPSALS
jgi:uncharacterized protein YbjT (DUF2867 family)